MSQLVYTVTDFPNGLRADKLRDDIRAVVSYCDYIAQNGSDIVVYFTAPLADGDQTLVDAIIHAHMPPPPTKTVLPFITQGSSLVRHEIHDSVVTFVGSQTNEIHISKEPQGHFSSITAAIAANPGQDKVFILHPGDYIEPTITFEAGTVLTACGNAENTFITAINPVQTMINMHVKCKLQGVCIRGGAVGVYFNQALSGGRGKYSAMMECFIQDCYVGIDCDAMNIHIYGGIADTLYGREIVISSTTRALSKGVNVRRGGTLISAGVTMFGVPPIGPAAAIPIMIGYNCEDAMSKLAMSITNCYFCGVAFKLDAGASSEMTLLTLKYNGAGVVIGSGAGSTRFSVNSLEIASSQTNDLTVLNPGALVEVHSGVFDDTKIYNPAGARLNMRYHTNKNGKTRQSMMGIINVGTVSEPSKMIIGEGSYDITNVAYLQNDNLQAGTWTDVTADAIEDNGAPFGLFASTTIGNCLYIGRDRVPMGCKIGIVTPASGSIVWEKWDGVAWQPIYTMSTGAEQPFIYSTAPFATVGSYHIRFGLRSDDPMPVLTLNGVSKKWVRARVVSTLSAVPTSEYILAHVSACKIGSDGYVEYFGDARTVKKQQWSIADMSGTKTQVWASKHMTTPAVLLNNIVGLSMLVTPDIDCSFPIKIQMNVVSDTTETLTLTLYYGRHAATMYADSASAPDDVSSCVVMVSVTANTLACAYAYCVIDHVDEHPLWISVECTSVGNVKLVQAGAYYMSWTDGAHTLTW